MKGGKISKSFTELGMPTHQQLVVPILKAVNRLGGSAKVSEMAEEVLDLIPNSEELVLATYPNRPNDSVLIERIGWGRATAKRIGVLEQPDRGMYLLTDAGEKLLKLSDDLAFERVRELDREAYRAKRKLRKQEEDAVPLEEEDDVPDQEILTESNEEAKDRDWKSQLLNRLDELTPEGFE